MFKPNKTKKELEENLDTLWEQESKSKPESEIKVPELEPIYVPDSWCEFEEDPEWGKYTDESENSPPDSWC